MILSKLLLLLIIVVSANTLQPSFDYIKWMCNELSVSGQGTAQDVAAKLTVEATPARRPATVDSIKEGLGELFDITHGRCWVVEKLMFSSGLL